MATVLSVLVALPFAAFLAVAWRAHRQARTHARRCADLEHREAHLLAAVRSFIDASRSSSDDVLRTLAQSVERVDSTIDVVLAFVPDGEDLACIFVHGVRAEHYHAIRLRREAHGYLPARAAVAGHRVRGSTNVMIPTDRVALAVPLHDERCLRAVVYVSSADASGIFEEDTVVRTIEHAAAPYAMALEREADRTDATYDGLTGLLTPRAFRTRLQEEMIRARFGNAAVTLWFIDTDKFKSVNDSFGHAAGDIVLQSMAGLLRAHAVPDVDVVGRNGGDEFCALLYGVQKTVAIERAQAFCDAVRTHEFGMTLRVTASIGVATYPYDAQSSSELLEIADAAMYHSKRTGRDRVSFAVEPATFAVFTSNDGYSEAVH